MYRWIVGSVILGLTVVAVAADGDPWLGRARDDVVTALGQPTKSKVARDGSEKLVYRFYRLREGAVPGARMMPVVVDGIGLLYHVVEPDTEAAEYEPTTIDEDGRPIAGGARSTVGGSTSYDTESGEVRRDWDMDDTIDIAGKVKLTLSLDPDGRVADWSVSPKSARNRQPPP